VKITIPCGEYELSWRPEIANPKFTHYHDLRYDSASYTHYIEDSCDYCDSYYQYTLRHVPSGFRNEVCEGHLHRIPREFDAYVELIKLAVKV
jgi:hypothetical protein